MEKRKLTNENLNSLISAAVAEKKYDLDLACDVSSLVKDLKGKIEEDFVAISKIKEKLGGIDSAARIIEDLNYIHSGLKGVESRVNNLMTYITPRA